MANQLPGPAAEILFAELLNRLPEITCPLLAQIADQPSHPMDQPCREFLKALLESPPPKGKSRSEWVKSQPDFNS